MHIYVAHTPSVLLYKPEPVETHSLFTHSLNEG